MNRTKFRRAAMMLLMMLLTTATAWANIRTVTYTYTDYRAYTDANGNKKVEATFTATGDVNATYIVDITGFDGTQSVSFTLGDLHVSWASSDTYFSAGNFGGLCMGGTAGYSNWTFTISSDNYYIDNVKYYNPVNELRMEQDNDTKSCAITANNVAFGGIGLGIHAFTVMMSDAPAYIIHYELNGGKASSNTNPAYYETATGTTLTDPTRVGYDFDGWYDNEGLTGSPVTAIPAGSTGTVTLYAKWTIHTYTISYVLNEGTNPKNARTSYTIETATFNLPTPSRYGYYFRGWYLNEDFASAQWTQIKEGTHADFTFYAKWEEGKIEGKGTKWRPYKISSEAQLRALATKVNGGDKCEGEYYQQTCDITITGGDWTPIGTKENHFWGNYDGGNYTISGINISNTSNYQGLFGRVQGSSVKEHWGFIQNVILENSTIAGGSFTGGIVGWLAYGHVLNCHVRSNVTVQAGVDGKNRYGGVVGEFYNGTVTDCTSMATVNKGNYSSISNLGGVIGDMEQSDNNTATATNSFSFGMKPIGHKYKTATINNVEQVYKMNCTDGSITLPETVGDTDGFYYDGVGYYKKDVVVPLTVTLSEPAAGYALSVSYNDGSDHTIAPNADGDYLYTTTASDVTVQASIIPDPVHFSQDGDEYTIYTADGWGVFCDALQDNDTYNRFSGKTVKLGNDIEVTSMAGSSNHDFCGTFDGQGNTLTFNSTGNTDRVAPFSYISTTKANPSDAADSPAAIRNLNVVANITTNGQHAGGIVGEAWGKFTIEHCTVSGTITTSKQFAGGIIGSVSNSPLDITDCVSSVTINSSKSGDGTHGGFAGRVPSSATLNISGCVFDGKIVTTNGTTNCGGFVGHSENLAGNNVSIANSLYAPTADDNTVSEGCMTFARNVTDANISNCYYTRLLGTAQGKQAMPLANTDGINLGNSTTYDVSGITAYAKGILYDGTYYCGANDEVTMDYTRTIPAGTDAYTTCLPYTPPTDGLTYYTLSGVSGTTLTFTEVANPAANTPYLVVASTNDASIGKASAAVTFGTSIQNPAAVNGYAFKGTLTGLDHAASEGKYILQSQNKWCKVAGGTVLIPPFRAYIEATGSGAPLLNSDFESGTTAIDSIRTVGRDGTEQWFDLSGRRIAAPRKGINIVNGHKVVIK